MKYKLFITVVTIIHVTVYSQNNSSEIQNDLNPTTYPFLSTEITFGYPYYMYKNKENKNNLNSYSGAFSLTGNLKYLKISFGYSYSTKCFTQGNSNTSYSNIDSYDYKLEYHNLGFDFISPITHPDFSPVSLFLFYGFQLNFPYGYKRVVNFKNGNSIDENLLVDYQTGLSCRLGLKYEKRINNFLYFQANLKHDLKIRRDYNHSPSQFNVGKVFIEDHVMVTIIDIGISYHFKNKGKISNWLQKQEAIDY